MPDENESVPGNVNHELIEKINRTLDRVANLQEQNDLRTAEIDRQMVETSAQIDKTNIQVAETNKKMAELIDSEKLRDKRIGDLGNKFGDFTEELALPSIRRILNVNFQADFRDALRVRPNGSMDELQIDAWGVARKGVKTVYLLAIKSKFEEKHFKQLRRQLVKFRSYVPEYADYRVCQAVAAVKVDAEVRKKIFDKGIYLIDISDGVFMLAEMPDGFEPNGNHEAHVHSRGVPHLCSVPDLPTEEKQA